MQMEKTTVYLPRDLRAAVGRAAAVRGVSQAEVVRDFIRAGVVDGRPRPHGGLYAAQCPSPDALMTFLMDLASIARR